MLQPHRKQLFEKLFGRRNNLVARRQRHRRETTTLMIEPLEARTVLSAISPTAFTDTGAGSLRAAIIAANADTGKGTDVITLQAGTYSLTKTGSGEDNAATGDLDITSTSHKLIIQGQGSAGSHATIIDASALGDRVFQIVNPGAQVELKNIVITGGVGDFGGGIFNGFGNLTLTNVAITGNKALSGGGIYSVGGLLALVNVDVSGNTAEGPQGIDPPSGSGGRGGDGFGGGIYVGGTVTTLTSCTIENNTAKGGRGGNAQTTSVFDANIGGEGGRALGGGLYAGDGSSLALTNVSVTGNLAIGGNGGRGDTAFFRADGGRGGAGGGGGIEIFHSGLPL